MTNAESWIQQIDRACAEPDMARCNRLVTKLHFDLSNALAERLGFDSGPNFHTWAVWGSRKAGVTIRQEDLGSAIINATRTAGVVGAVVGAGAGCLAGRSLRWKSNLLAGALGAAIGAYTGSQAGKQLALWSRAEAARLVLKGNTTVLRDIGTQSARFLELLAGVATPSRRSDFFAGIRCGSTESGGQDRLAHAFHYYLAALDTSDLQARRSAMIAGNCAIVYHEHIRLDPYIRAAMPFIIRHCATQRLMTYEVGDTILQVAEDVPGFTTHTGARNWTSIRQRMRYIFALFEQFHTDPQVFANPYPDVSSQGNSITAML